MLKPVYGLGLINSEFDLQSDDWYHHYKIVNVEKPQCEIKDLHLEEEAAYTRGELKLMINTGMR